MRNQPLQLESDGVASQAARALIGIREMVLRGEFGRGERISEQPLVTRLGVSRTPIRLALERLAHVGLVQTNLAGGFTVREFSKREVQDAIEIRGVLEGTAARLAAERLSDSGELRSLRHYYQQMGTLERLTVDSFQIYMDLNESFHAALLDLAKSAMLRRNLEQAMSLPFCSPSAMVFPSTILPASDETLAIAQEHHRSIIEAISNREGTRAEAMAREHALLSRRVLDVALSHRDALLGVPGGPLINVSSGRIEEVPLTATGGRPRETLDASPSQLTIELVQVSSTTSEATVRAHQVLIDRPVENGGTDLGPMGGELFLTAIGGCFVSNLLAAIRTRKSDVTDVRAMVVGLVVPSPARFSAVEVHLQARGHSEEINRLVEIADRGCTMMNTIRGKIVVRIHTRVAE